MVRKIPTGVITPKTKQTMFLDHTLTRTQGLFPPFFSCVFLKVSMVYLFHNITQHPQFVQ